ncbi:unnamed protein product [Ixodes hexagonus]
MVAQIHPAEFIVFGSLTTINLAIGLYFAMCNKHRDLSTEEVFLGGRSLGAIPLSLSVLATMVTAIGVVGFTTHFYAYGFHLLWACVPVLALVPFFGNVVIPIIYNLKVTSVFQYIRMRFGNKVGITAFIFYFFLNQVQGAVGIFAAAVAISTSFRVSLVGSTLAIGAAGTVYTALGGLRGVVWTDCMQGILVLICPITIIVKICYDSVYDPETRVRPLSDLNFRPYLFEASFDFTNDENVWASMIAVSCSHLYRMGMDQMVVQRYAAARTLHEAKRTALMGSILLVISYLFLGAVALSLVYWYRDCDPLLAGFITKVEQVRTFTMIPQWYIHRCYTVRMNMHPEADADRRSARSEALGRTWDRRSGTVYVDAARGQDGIATVAVLSSDGEKTISVASVKDIESVARAEEVFMVLYGSASGPFVGLYMLALAFPWVGAKGAAVSACLTMALQIWAMSGKLMAGVHPPRMPSTLDYCPENITTGVSRNSTFAPANMGTNGTQPFLLYRLSSNWSGFIGVFLTIVIGLGVSALTGEPSKAR